MLTFWVVEKILGERQYREAAVGVNISLNGNMTMEELSIYLDANLARMSRIKSENMDSILSHHPQLLYNLLNYLLPVSTSLPTYSKGKVKLCFPPSFSGLERGFMR